MKNKIIKNRYRALEVLQKETDAFEEQSRLREDVIDAMVAFKKVSTPSIDEIKQASLKDYKDQKTYDNGFDRKKGFIAGVNWILSALN